jgi:hypothetical protein
VDSLIGLFMWDNAKDKCPKGLVQIFRGQLKIFVQSTSSFLQGLVKLEVGVQVVGLKLGSAFLHCHHPTFFRTHLQDIPVVVHVGNVK